MKLFKDKAGTVLVPSDLIVYGHALGRSAGLRYGKVLAIVEGCCYDLHGTKSPKIKIQVIGVCDDWDDPPSLLLKESVLEFSKRVLRVTKDQIPSNILSLLEGYTPKTKGL